MRKLLLCAVLCACLIIQPMAAAARFSVTVEDASRIDLTQGRLSGVRAQFYMDVPNAWKYNVTAERESTAKTAPLIEKINFYCSSLSGIYKAQLLMTLAVFDREKWKDDGKYEPLLKSKDYVFAVKYGVNGFVLKGDVTMYMSAILPANTPLKAARLIKLPEGQEIAQERAVMVNGERMFYELEVVNGVYFIRVREVCAALGYTVNWNGPKSTVTIARDGFTDSFKVAKSPVSERGFSVRNIEGRVYVSAAYFSRVLGLTVEIDQKKNVYIYSD